MPITMGIDRNVAGGWGGLGVILWASGWASWWMEVSWGIFELPDSILSRIVRCNSGVIQLTRLFQSVLHL